MVNLVVAFLVVLVGATSAEYHFDLGIREFLSIIAATPQSFTVAGLSLDAFGVMFLVLFPPPQFRRLVGPGSLGLQGADGLAQRHPWLRWIGPALIVIGFGLQIIGNLAEIF